MQIVINISKENYSNIKVGALQRIAYDELLCAVDNGIVLPKGYGNLISKQEVLEIIEQYAYIDERNSTAARSIMDDIEEDAEIIIEADKEK